VTAIIAVYGCESWTLRKNEETRLDAFEMNGLRKILRVSWQQRKKTIEWVPNKAGVKGELLDTVTGNNLALCSHHEETRKLPGEKDNTRNNTRCIRATKTTHGLNLKTSIRGQDSAWKRQSE